MEIQRKGESIHLIPREHKTTLVWLHGLGDSAEGFLEIFASSESPAGPTTKVVLLSAPEMKVSVNYGMKMRAWFDCIDINVTRANYAKALRLSDVAESQRLVGRVLEEEIALLKKVAG